MICAVPFRAKMLSQMTWCLRFPARDLFRPGHLPTCDTKKSPPIRSAGRVFETCCTDGAKGVNRPACVLAKTLCRVGILRGDHIRHKRQEMIGKRKVHGITGLCGNVGGQIAFHHHAGVFGRNDRIIVEQHAFEEVERFRRHLAEMFEQVRLRAACPLLIRRAVYIRGRNIFGVRSSLSRASKENTHVQTH